jgi:hypothetical protein
MTIIEKPVIQIENSSELCEISVVLVALLKSLNKIYKTSNFYKEVRIVSFIDKLLTTVKTKIMKK